MRRLLLLTPLLLGASAPEGGLAEAETKAVLATAEAKAKLADWAVRNKLLVRARWTYDEALLWDPARADWKKARAAIDDMAPDADDAKLQYAFQDLQKAGNQAAAKAFLKLAQDALKAKAFGMARRLAERVQELEAGAEGLDAVRQALAAKEAADSLSALDARIARAREGSDLLPAAKHAPECLLRLPKGFNPSEDRRSALVFLKGKAEEPPGALEGFRAEGFAVLVLACDSRLDKGNARDDAEDVLTLLARVSADLGLDSRKLLLAARGTGSDAAWVLVEKNRGRFRGAAFLEPELHRVVERIPKPDAFPILVQEAQKPGESLQDLLLKAQYAGARPGSEEGLLAWAQKVLTVGIP